MNAFTEWSSDASGINFSIEDEKWFPLRLFFNLLPEAFFLRAVEQLLCGVGLGLEGSGCYFYDPNDPENNPKKEPYEGALFVYDRFNTDEHFEVNISHKDLQNVLRLIARGYVERHPTDELKLRHLFEAKGLKFLD